MALRGMKTLNAPKGDTIVEVYTSGVAVVPDASMLGVYVDMYPEEIGRELEVIERLRDLVNYAKEEGYNRPIAGTVAICVRGTTIGEGRGSLIIDSAFKEIIDYMRETDQLT